MTHRSKLSGERLVAALRDPASYPEHPGDGIEVHETHISWVFLTEHFAYKVKKPIRTDYLDYSSLEKRAHYCREELRLNRRYAPGLYLDVVPIVAREGTVQVGGQGSAIEYAVKMHRFPDDALLSQQVERNELGLAGVRELARTIAQFHTQASPASDDRLGCPDSILQWARGNFSELASAEIPGTARALEELAGWTENFGQRHRATFSRRILNGFIRECHGDLHLANVIRWQGQLVPFDGIEFNRELRWIDVLNDAGFLAMDLAARGHLELSRSFVSDYLEHTGDYASLSLLRFYVVYRALVRAKILATRAGQSDVTESERRAGIEDCRGHIELARETATPPKPSLWITHGVSGSGKSTGCEEVIERHGAIRLRSDVERKRFHGLHPSHRPWGSEIERLYSRSADQATYRRLRQLAQHILHAGYPVIVDATFLSADRRREFAEFARADGVPFRILDFPCDEQTLRRRIADRVSRGNDVSDAGIEVLEKQLRTAEPLTAEEMPFVVTMPGVIAASEELSPPRR